MTTETMSMEEFEASGAQVKSGAFAWLRNLPLNTPTPLPESFDARKFQGGAHGWAAGLGIKVKTRTINGRVWVARVQ